MQAKKILAFATLLAATVVAQAGPSSPLTLNFQDRGDTENANYFGSSAYNGLNFSSNAYTIGSAYNFCPGGPDSNGDCGFAGGNFKPDPSSSSGIALTADGNDSGANIVLTMTLADTSDFFSQFSMDFVGAQGASATVTLLDSLGEVLDSQNFAAAGTNGCDQGYFCNWSDLSLSGFGDAASVQISMAGNGNLFYFDNVDFGAISGPTTPGNSVPEPAALSVAALGALALVRRRRKA